MRITVGIKALNEAEHIEACIASALRAVRSYSGEVILADSGSTDGTVALASRYPIRIVQFRDWSERNCGAAAQLAFQHAQGEYFYLLDGDMVLDDNFIAVALNYLADHPQVAAVAGAVVEQNLQSAEFKIRARAARAEKGERFGLVDRLDGGGLYRTSAVRETGWFGDRNLHAFEEFDLGARLQARGWKLARIENKAVDHYGHTTGGYRLMLRRMMSGYTAGTGEVLRAALGQPHLPLVLKNLKHVRQSAAVILWWLSLLAAGALCLGTSTVGLPLLGLLLLAPMAFLSWRRGGLSLGIYSLVQWNMAAVGLIQGLLRGRVDPTHPISSREIMPENVRE